MIRVTLCVILLPALATARERVPCSYNRGVQERCAPVGCVVPSELLAGLDLADGDPPADTDGFCGSCKTDSDCGGATCNEDGTCSQWDRPIPVEPERPTLSLLTAEISLDALDIDAPVIGVGYMFQIALDATSPVELPDGGWLTVDVPQWYASAEATLAFAGAGQNLYARLGVTRYLHRFVTSVSAGAMIQRQGGEVWDFASGNQNLNRLGAFAAVEFIYNIRVGVAFLVNLDAGSAINGDDAVALFLGYQRDLLADLLPDRYLSLVPAKYR